MPHPRSYRHARPNGRLALFVASMLLLWGCASRDEVPAADGADARPPNLVVVVADDLGWRQVGVYGTDYYETPHIDGLARDGLRFTDAYAAAPVCSPTRAALWTGRYPARLHLTDFIAGGDPPPDSPLLHPAWQKHLPLEEVTIAERLKQLGYATAHFGKWHLSRAKTPPESLPHNPDRQGFDSTFVTYKPVPSMAQSWQDAEDDAHNVEIITRKALAFIDAHRDRPFFLVTSHNTIHTPLMEKEALVEKYRAKPGAGRPENNPVIGAMMETLDRAVGRLLQKLDAHGLTRNTLVVFVSDNGGLDRDGRTWVADQRPLRAGKGDLYEGGIRVPMIVRWPGAIRPGGVSDAVVSSIDLFPTLLAAAGVAETAAGVDGVSLLPVLTGAGGLDRRAIYWHYPHYHSAGSGPSGAVRQGRYKLLEFFEDDHVELYDLRGDLGERHDLSVTMPEKAAALRRTLAAWRRSVGAQMPPERKTP